MQMLMQTLKKKNEFDMQFVMSRLSYQHYRIKFLKWMATLLENYFNFQDFFNILVSEPYCNKPVTLRVSINSFF